MKKGLKSTLRLVVTFAAIVFSLQVGAAVYKWVDAEGNVHFSDKPQDAEQGEQVNVDVVNVMEGGDDLAESAEKNRQRVAEQQKKDAQALAEAAKATDPCEADLDKYRALSQTHNDKNGKPYYYYMDNEDGSPMSLADHNKMVKELEENLRKRGCL